MVSQSFWVGEPRLGGSGGLREGMDLRISSAPRALYPSSVGLMVPADADQGVCQGLCDGRLSLGPGHSKVKATLRIPASGAAAVRVCTALRKSEHTPCVLPGHPSRPAPSLGTEDPPTLLSSPLNAIHAHHNLLPVFLLCSA